MPQSRARTEEAASASALPVWSRVAIEQSDGPRPGVQPQSFYWADVFRDAAPLVDRPRDRWFAVLEPEMVDSSVRVEDVLLARAVLDEDRRQRVELEFRLCVSPRVLAPLLRAEERVVGGMVPAGHPLRGLRKLTRGALSLPDRFQARWSDARKLLATADGRARVKRGLLNPRELTRREKAITLFVASLAIFAPLALVYFILALVVPHVLVPVRAAIVLFAFVYAQSLGAPVPMEPALVVAVTALHRLPTLGVAVLAKLVAGWMVLFIGEELNEELEKKAATRPWLAKLLHGSERFARRFGVAALATLIAIPGLPDAIGLYLFSTLDMPPRRYLVGIAIGAVLLDSVLVYGLASLLHLG